MGFSESSMLSKVGLGLSIAAVVFDIIGFPTPYWTSASGFVDVNGGLFQTCTGGVCTDNPVSVDWLDAAKALNILGFLLGLGSAIVVVLYVAVKNDMKILQLVGIALAFAAGIFIIIGSAVYGAKATEGDQVIATLSWSFALTIIGGVLFLAEGVVLLMDKCMVG